ncbi:hypothetical protein ACPOL_1386 [Acidisarcina polymorpha]|uniref:Uncharacterized protein n=1 Tax=Acidisarcina polymorpha TaxID=2211140 RepID=A0A2Z5FW56_9BACT|nr:hypothetical protein ACPOL_1386 [Acidisarcina polymorpha]
MNMILISSLTPLLSLLMRIPLIYMRNVQAQTSYGLDL